LLIGLGSSYNVQALLSVLLMQMIPLAIIVNTSENIRDETSHYFTLLTELLQTVDLDSTLVDTVVRFVSLNSKPVGSDCLLFGITHHFWQFESCHVKN